MSSSITDNLWLYIPEKFGGVRKPLNESEVTELISVSQVKGIISLLDDEENLDLYRSIGIEFLHLPVKGGTAPTSEQLKSALDFQRSLNGLVAVHCTNGRRRTGTLLGALFIKLLQSGAIARQSEDSVFLEMKARLLKAKPDCDLRDGQWDWLDTLSKE